MSPPSLQLETRCTLDKVHFVLSEQQRRNPFWSQPATFTLQDSDKGQRVIPKVRVLRTTEMLGARANLISLINRKAYKHSEVIQREAGIQQLTAKQCSLSTNKIAERMCRGSLNVLTKMERGKKLRESSPYLRHSIGTCARWSEISSQQSLILTSTKETLTGSDRLTARH